MNDEWKSKNSSIIGCSIKQFFYIYYLSENKVQWYSITGVLGGTLWVLIVNIIGFEIIKHILYDKESFQQQKKRILYLCGVLFIPVIISLTTYYSYCGDKRKSVNVAVIQPELDTHTEKYHINYKILLQNIGDIIKATNCGKKTGLTEKVYLNNEKTFYVLYGDYLGQIAEIILILLFVYSLIRYFTPQNNIPEKGKQKKRKKK